MELEEKLLLLNENKETLFFQIILRTLLKMPKPKKPLPRAKAYLQGIPEEPAAKKARLEKPYDKDLVAHNNKITKIKELRRELKEKERKGQIGVDNAFIKHYQLSMKARDAHIMLDAQRGQPLNVLQHVQKHFDMEKLPRAEQVYGSGARGEIAFRLPSKYINNNNLPKAETEWVQPDHTPTIFGRKIDAPWNYVLSVKK